MGLADTTLAEIRPDAVLWRMTFHGLRGDGDTEIRIGRNDDDRPEVIAARLRRELRQRRCPVCVGRARADGHTEAGYRYELQRIACEKCRNPYVIAHPTRLHFLRAAEEGRRDVLSRLPALQRAIQQSDELLTITPDNWMAIAHELRRA